MIQEERESTEKLLEELSGQVAVEGRQREGEVARGYTEGGLVLIPDKHAGNPFHS